MLFTSVHRIIIHYCKLLRFKTGLLVLGPMMAKQNQEDIALFTSQEEELLRGHFAATWIARLSILVIALFLGFLGIWVFTSMMAQAKMTTPSRGMITIHKFIKGFHLAGVTMGMTPDLVRSIHPKLGVEPGKRQITRGNFVANHTPYTVWFADLSRASSNHNNKRGQVYRIRYHRRYNISDENEALNIFGRKLGRPLSTSCLRGQLTASAKTCVFKWLRKGVEVTLVSKVINFINADPRVYVSITATDTLIAAKLKRRNTQQQLAHQPAQSRAR